ncbi:hypothetical protein KGV52_00315 [Candidatus Gracilibacteria bacterium]|nr:hypothetical protein [Candidatus Gracilibacteria bacterium]
MNKLKQLGNVVKTTAQTLGLAAILSTASCSKQQAQNILDGVYDNTSSGKEKTELVETSNKNVRADNILEKYNGDITKLFTDKNSLNDYEYLVDNYNDLNDAMKTKVENAVFDYVVNNGNNKVQNSLYLGTTLYADGKNQCFILKGDKNVNITHDYLDENKCSSNNVAKQNTVLSKTEEPGVRNATPEEEQELFDAIENGEVKIDY